MNKIDWVNVILMFTMLYFIVGLISIMYFLLIVPYNYKEFCNRNGYDKAEDYYHLVLPNHMEKGYVKCCGIPNDNHEIDYFKCDVLKKY